MKKILIVGGGTAGWLTAVHLNWTLANTDITVIESSEIGILGAGEGTTPHFVKFLEDVNIDVGHFLAHTKGTIKNGIKFTNWNGDGKSYFHPFSDGEPHIGGPVAAQKLIADSVNLDLFKLSARASEKFKTKYFKFARRHYDRSPPYSKYELFGSCALHFDANLVAQYLKNVALSRGVKCVDGVVNKIYTNDKNFITGVGLENKEDHGCDILFDCTGLRRLFIGEHYKSEWVSYKSHIPNDRAQPFILPMTTDKIPPYTEAVAMKHGWAWVIPVDGRYGCGYVYDSKHATEEDIKQEIVSVFGDQAQILNKSFKFNAGAFKTPWVNNCVAIGLASGFIEPLEATSIWVTIITLRELTPELIDYCDDLHVKYFNERVNRLNEGVLDFIYFHYITKRQDTEYWKNFEVNNEPTPLIKKYKEKFSLGFNDKEVTPKESVFGIDSWISVGVGLNFFNPEFCIKNLNAHARLKNINGIEERLQNEMNHVDELAGQFVDHKSFLDEMKKQYCGIHEN